MAIDVVEYDSKWEKLAGTRFTMQHSFFNPHDFAITPDYYLFFQVQSIFRIVFRIGANGTSMCIHPRKARDLC